MTKPSFVYRRAPAVTFGNMTVQEGVNVESRDAITMVMIFEEVTR